MASRKKKLVTDERERLARNWAALRAACLDYHRTYSKGAGGHAMCICGEGCGGSAACSMLKELGDFIVYLPANKLPKEWREMVELLRSVI